MPSLPWSQQLEIGFAAMDQTHREFVHLLAQAQGSSDAALPAAWHALIDHTVAHFAQEDAWMRATQYARAKSHIVQHRVILQVMREGAARAAEGNLTSVRLMTSELAVWFPQHAQTLDMPLAAHLAAVGFEPASAPGGIQDCHCGPLRQAQERLDPQSMTAEFPDAPGSEPAPDLIRGPGQAPSSPA